MSNENFVTQQSNNILQITGDAQVPPTVVFQVRDADDLLTVMMNSTSDAANHGQYVIFTENITLANATSWPATGALVRHPTTITTWPGTYVVWDLLTVKDAFRLGATVQIKDMVLVNLPPDNDLNEYGGLTSGLWSFNITNWRVINQQQVSVEHVALVVSPQEVKYYLDATVNWDGKTPNAWVNSFKVDSYDAVNRTWVHYRYLATIRFTAQNVNITSVVPDAFDMIPVTLPATPGSEASDDGQSKGAKTREILMFALLAITLPSVLVAACITILVLKRRRLGRICGHGDEAAKHMSDEEYAGQMYSNPVSEEDAEGAPTKSDHSTADMACCLRLPLRKAKYVNPLFAEPGAPPPEVVLTGVLLPVSLEGRLSNVLERPGELEGDELASTSLSTQTHLLSGDRSVVASPMAAALASGGAGRGVAAPAELEEGPSGSAHASGQLVVFGDRPVVPSELPGPSSAGEAGACAAAALAAGTEYGGIGRLPNPPYLGVGSSTSGESRDQHATSTADQDQLQLERRLSGRDTSISGAHAAAAAAQGAAAAPAGSMSPRLMELQRLDKLQREIGDRHLEVHHSLGWGGCGVVYKGTWKGLPVAVKTVLVQGDSRQSKQFLTEAAISASLQHANIVTTYLYELRPLDEVDPGSGGMEIHVRQDATRTTSDSSHSGTVPGPRMACWKLYIVQEYCELGTLKSAIDQGYFRGTRPGLPNMAFVLAIAGDLAAGLAHVHSKGVVHGDITVSNILLQASATRPQGCVAKLADFGLSVKFDAGQTHTSHMYGGTPHYMAPERTRGHLSRASDIYAMGVCLWEVYCGTPPWRRNGAGGAGAGRNRYGGDVHSYGSSDGHTSGYGGEAMAVAYGAGNDVYAFPRGCPSEYSALVLSCLEAEPSGRPTATGVAEVVQRLQRRYG
ncbi:hypothetical protein HYH03_007516 [Edaphochlamys debaryana]|uniref:Protein kinase domain-containing protein n=1 Tax=Edaphochlamys debaryana TaxID=47281 RepID=A0A835YBF5_9CHLO|nr:hypothetical protein HYH03_007516 [Edaphochlamys debaryana]|eukprot:KAG2494464.1 hypothetical protein HYH03_007516 [Edaphochlamys debaryana]